MKKNKEQPVRRIFEICGLDYDTGLKKEKMAVGKLLTRIYNKGVKNSKKQREKLVEDFKNLLDDFNNLADEAIHYGIRITEPVEFGKRLEKLKHD